MTTVLKDFLYAVFELVCGADGKIDVAAHKESALLIFATSCAAMGVLVVAFDRIVVSAGRSSFLRVGYGSVGQSIRMICVWGLGAGLGGFLLAAVDAVTLTRMSCLIIGVGWPLAVPRLLESISETEDFQSDNTTEERGAK